MGVFFSPSAPDPIVLARRGFDSGFFSLMVGFTVAGFMGELGVGDGVYQRDGGLKTVDRNGNGCATLVLDPAWILRRPAEK